MKNEAKFVFQNFADPTFANARKGQNATFCCNFLMLALKLDN